MIVPLFQWGSTMFNVRVQYALVILLDVNSVRHQGPTRAADLAVRNRLNKKLTQNVMIQLRSAELLKVRRGKGGGYIINKSLEDISIADVFSAVREDLPSAELGTTPTSTEGYRLSLFLKNFSEQIKQGLVETNLQEVLHE